MSSANEQVNFFFKNIEVLLKEFIEIIKESKDIIQKNNLSLDVSMINGILVLMEFMDDKSKLDYFNHFIIGTYRLWDEIKNRDRDFLINHLSESFQGDKSIKDIQFLLGNNSTGTKYLDNDTEEFIWESFDAMIINCLKYCHYTGITFFDYKSEMKKRNITI